MTEDDAAEAPEQTVQEVSLADRVAEHDESLAEEVAALESEVEELRAENEDLRAERDDLREDTEELEERVKRVQADFQNYKKRAKKKQERMEERATEDLVERLLGVRDNLSRAVDEDTEDVESLREGVEMTLSEFDRVLDDEGVEEISPDPGSEVDANRHEVMMRVDADEPEGTIAEVYRPGYEMGDKVLRPAQVTVSDGE